MIRTLLLETPWWRELPSRSRGFNRKYKGYVSDVDEVGVNDVCIKSTSAVFSPSMLAGLSIVARRKAVP